MSKFIVIGEVIDEHRTCDVHVNTESILYFEAAAKGSIAKTEIRLVSVGPRRRSLFVAEDVSAVQMMLGPVAALKHLSGMSNANKDVFVLPAHVKLVTGQRPRPVQGQMATIEFLDGSELDVDDAVALIALL